MATLQVDMDSLLDQLNEVAALQQFAADTYGAYAGMLPEEFMRAKAEEFKLSAEAGRDAAIDLMKMLGGEPAPVKQGLASVLAGAKGLASAGRAGRFGRLKNLQDMLLAAFLSAGGWAIVQWAAYGIGDPRLIEVAEREVKASSLPVQWLLVTIAERSAWAVLR